MTEDDEEESGYVCVCGGADFSWVVRGGLAEDGAPSWDGGRGAGMRFGADAPCGGAAKGRIRLELV